MKYMNTNTRASDPLALTVSREKLILLRPDLYGYTGLIKKLKAILFKKIDHLRYIREQISFGDSQPAVVISVKPVRVAAYSDEMDCIAMLEFPDGIAKLYSLQVGSRLITINTYKGNLPYHEDLLIGEGYLGKWFGFCPTIADFVSDNMALVNARKQAIDEERWAYVYDLGVDYYKNYPNRRRNGRPGFSSVPAKLI